MYGFASLSAPVPWPLSFSRSNITGKDAAYRSVCRMFRDSAKVWGLRLPVSLPAIPAGVSDFTLIWASLSGWGAVLGETCSLGAGAADVLPWTT